MRVTDTERLSRLVHQRAASEAKQFSTLNLALQRISPGKSAMGHSLYVCSVLESCSSRNQIPNCLDFLAVAVNLVIP